MKKYVKPALMALELEADTVLCSNCEVNADNNPMFDWLRNEYGDDFSKLFGTEEQCEIPDVVGYCKFTAETTNIFDS